MFGTVKVPYDVVVPSMDNLANFKDPKASFSEQNKASEQFADLGKLLASFHELTDVLPRSAKRHHFV